MTLEATPEEIIEDLGIALESAANFMRGLMLDSSLPRHIADAVGAKVREIDHLTERFD